MEEEKELKKDKEGRIMISGFVPLLDKLDKTNELLEKMERNIWFLDLKATKICEKMGISLKDK